MIPAAFVLVGSIPLTANGKVDRKALPAPAFHQRDPALPYVAPRNTVERFLVQIWQEILGVEPIGITDVFTTLGGDSLTALAIFSKIELEFGKRLPVNVLAEAHTIEQLAPEVRRESTPPPWPSLVPLNGVSTDKPAARAPLFLVHGAGGHVYTFYLFARALGADQPVYALRSQGLDGVAVPCHSLEAMSAHYIREFRTVQPHGPYYLSGFSGGGKITFEMAIQLRAAGEEVAMLAAIDSVVTEKLIPDAEADDPYADLAAHGLSEAARPRSITRLLYRQVIQPIVRYVKGPDPLGDPRWSPEKRIRWANRRASRRYELKPYDGSIVLFRSEQMKVLRHDPRSFWEPWVSGGVQMIDIPGDHDSIHREPDVNVLAEKFAAILKDIQNKNEPPRT
jgi:thioesterase domain-containing protein/acyl carrier protein